MSERIEISKRYLYSQVLRGVIHNSQQMEQPKRSSKEEQIKKMSYVHTVEYYSALEKEKILPHATAWTDFAGIILSEISQSQQGKHCMIPLM